MGAESIDAYEGLVKRTSQMFHSQVGLESDDMRQELRVAVWKARLAYRSTRSRLSERSFVYGCVANRVKDLKRDAARRARKRVIVVHIADDHFDWFEFTYRQVSHDEVFGAIEDGSFRLPATITELEKEVLLLLVAGYSQTEIALSLDTPRWRVAGAVSALREKMADWKPSAEPLSPASTAESAAPTLAAA